MHEEFVFIDTDVTFHAAPEDPTYVDNEAIIAFNNEMATSFSLQPAHQQHSSEVP